MNQPQQILRDKILEDLDLIERGYRSALRLGAFFAIVSIIEGLVIIALVLKSH